MNKFMRSQSTAVSIYFPLDLGGFGCVTGFDVLFRHSRLLRNRSIEISFREFYSCQSANADLFCSVFLFSYRSISLFDIGRSFLWQFSSNVWKFSTAFSSMWCDENTECADACTFAFAFVEYKKRLVYRTIQIAKATESDWTTHVQRLYHSCVDMVRFWRCIFVMLFKIVKSLFREFTVNPSQNTHVCTGLWKHLPRVKEHVLHIGVHTSTPVFAHSPIRSMCLT